MDLEIKGAIQEIGTAFNEFKKSNDERLAKLEKGEGVADLEAKLAQINDKISKKNSKPWKRKPPAPDNSPRAKNRRTSTRARSNCLCVRATSPRWKSCKLKP